MAHLETPLWLMPNLLSLDAPVIAVVWQGFLASALHISVLHASRLALALSVWAIYLADRILDTRLPADLREASRHRFSRHHRSALVTLLCIVGLADVAVGALSASPLLLRDAMPLAALVITYLAIVHWNLGRLAPRMPKEFAVALLFTLGALLAPWIRAQDHGQLTVAGVALSLACLLNTVAIESYEWSVLRARAGPAPDRWTQRCAQHYGSTSAVLFTLCVAGAWTTSGTGLSEILLAVAFTTGAASAIHAMRTRLDADSYRVLVDMALLSPIPISLLYGFLA